jgi:multicomponent Na+:H+ antiporter subunit B
VNSLLLGVLVRLLTPVLLLSSLFLLLRGHDLPGGGFIGGLVAATALILMGISMGSGRLSKSLKIRPATLMGWGLLVAAGSALPGALVYGVLFKGVWWEVPFFGGPLKTGTPVVFDVGVYLVVVGMVTAIYLSLEDD